MDNEDDPMIFPKVSFRTKRWEAQKALSKAEYIPHTAWIRRACDAWEFGVKIEGQCCDGSPKKED